MLRALDLKIHKATSKINVCKTLRFDRIITKLINAIPLKEGLTHKCFLKHTLESVFSTEEESQKFKVEVTKR